MKRALLLALACSAPLAWAQERLREPARWIHGGAPGAACSEPLQVHEAGPGIHVIRQNKCVNAEAPFMYLILGERRALLLDTGAEPGPGKDFPLPETVDRLIRAWQARRPGRRLGLLVAHTHNHRDHRHLDAAFRARPGTEVVGLEVAAVKAAFGLDAWPEGEASLDLGGRKLTVLPLPGHEAAHLAFYDHRSGTLFSGDSLYPGLLTVRDWPAYRRSVARLAAFAQRHPVTAIAGAHIEMTRRPGRMYPLGTLYQPEEHALLLGAEQLGVLHKALAAHERPARIDRPDFIVEPVAP